MRYTLPSRHRQNPPHRLVLAGGVLALLIGLAALGAAARVWAPAHRGAAASSEQTSPGIPLPVAAVVLSDAKSFGIAAGSSLPGFDPQQLDTRLNGIQASGARWIRLDFDWSQIQPDNSRIYNWSTYDRLVTAIAQHHLGILAILDYTPAWARPAGCMASSQCAPADTARFAAFAGSAARRYGPRGIHCWEVWNEPNNRSFWQPRADPAQYTRLLRQTYAALHTADPRAYVITAGLSPQATGGGAFAPFDFLSAVYQSGGRGSFDAVADHPYTFPLSPAAAADDAWTQMAGPAHSLRSLMTANGDSAKKLWITEFGAPTGGPGPVATIANPNLNAHPYAVDAALQARILTDAVRLYRSYPWAGPFFYYTYQDPGTDPSTNENFFGLVTAGGTEKPAYAVFQAAAQANL